VNSDFRLRPGQRRTLAALARVVCPPDMEARGLGAAVLEETELMIRAMPAYLRWGLVAGLLAFDQGYRFQRGSGGRPFAAAADPASAESYFERWHRSALSACFQFAKAVKGLLCFAYYEQPEVLEALGVHADRWIDEVGRRRLESYGAEVRRADEEVLG